MKKTILTILCISTMPLFADGASIYNDKCATCHGKNGEQKAMRKSSVLVGMTEDEVINDLEGYKDGKLNKHGMAGLMRAQVRTYTQKQIKDVAKHIATFKKAKESNKTR